jgi:hypothetical protein
VQQPRKQLIFLHHENLKLHLRNLSEQQCSGCISLITKLNPEDGGSMAFKMVVYNHQTTQHKIILKFLIFIMDLSWG